MKKYKKMGNYNEIKVIEYRSEFPQIKHGKVCVHVKDD